MKIKFELILDEDYQENENGSAEEQNVLMTVTLKKFLKILAWNILSDNDLIRFSPIVVYVF